LRPRPSPRLRPCSLPPLPVRTIYGDEAPYKEDFELSSEEIPFQEQRNSSITESEREVFARLFQNVTTLSPASPTTAQTARAAKVTSINKDKEKTQAETQEDGAKAARSQRYINKDKNIVERLPSDIKLMAIAAAEKIHYQEYLTQIRTELQSKPEIKIAKVSNDAHRKLQEEQFQRIERLLIDAKTDVELWEVLEKEVFSVIENLVSGQNAPSAGEAPKTVPTSTRAASTTMKSTLEAETANADKLAELALLGPNYPSLLVTAMRQLRVEFPSSQMFLAILPATKRLGRSSYVLGASTVLYNELIAAIWVTHGDFRQVNELLHEMDNAGLEFDANTLSVVDSIRREGNYGRRGTYGPTLQAVWKSDFIQTSWRRFVIWNGIIQQRLEANALRQANQEEYSSSSIDN
jgi:hypothetical protein